MRSPTPTLRDRRACNETPATRRSNRTTRTSSSRVGPTPCRSPSYRCRKADGRRRPPSSRPCRPQAIFRDRRYREYRSARAPAARNGAGKTRCSRRGMAPPRAVSRSGSRRVRRARRHQGSATTCPAARRDRDRGGICRASRARPGASCRRYPFGVSPVIACSNPIRRARPPRFVPIWPAGRPR